MENNIDLIEKHKEILLERFRHEQEINGCYEEWYSDLDQFRDSLKRFYTCKFGEQMYRMDNPEFVLPTGDHIDHHIIGYLAPLDFKRIGWNGILRSPDEQIVMLNNFLKKRGTRFIYVALPCKEVIYPQLIADEALLHGKTIIVPQWRYMLSKIVEKNVEVVDMLPAMKEKGEDIFAKTHYISHKGAKIISQAIKEYLEKTTKGLYNNKEYSEIGIFGNCNLQAYLDEKKGILANLILDMEYPISYIGRYLPFCCIDTMTESAIKELLKYKIVIYVGFPSASFVRTSAYWDRSDAIENRWWSSIDLDKL